jgi:tetratricopeptide (TPR) repeat protein
LLVSIELAGHAPYQAMKDFIEAIEKQPKDGAGYRALADLYLSQKNSNTASMVLLTGLQQQPNSAQSASLRQSQMQQFMDTLGWVSYRSGDFQAAIPPPEEAATALPDQALVRYHLAMSYVAARQDARMSNEFKAAVAGNPNGELREAIKAELNELESQ